MMSRPTPLLLVLLLVMSLTSLGGCAVSQQRYEGMDPDQVWLALVRVAQSPDYENAEDVKDRWILRQNDVTVFEDPARIEIYRELVRVRYLNTPKPRQEFETWRFKVLFDGEKATFTSRSLAVPGRALEEGDRYFGDVNRFLGIEEPEPVAETFDPEAPVQGQVYDG